MLLAFVLPAVKILINLPITTLLAIDTKVTYQNRLLSLTLTQTASMNLLALHNVDAELNVPFPLTAVQEGKGIYRK